MHVALVMLLCGVAELAQRLAPGAVLLHVQVGRCAHCTCVHGVGCGKGDGVSMVVDVGCHRVPVGAVLSLGNILLVRSRMIRRCTCQHARSEVLGGASGTLCGAAGSRTAEASGWAGRGDVGDGLGMHVALVMLLCGVAELAQRLAPGAVLLHVQVGRCAHCTCVHGVGCGKGDGVSMVVDGVAALVRAVPAVRLLVP